MHIHTFGRLMRELANVRDLDHIGRVIGEHAPPLIGAERVIFLVGAAQSDDFTPHGTDVEDLTIVPVGCGDPVASIGAHWSPGHTATPEAIIALQTIADASALAIQNVRLSQAVQQAHRQAEQGQRGTDALIATVAHELRQPIGAIINAVATIERRPSEQVGERARTILSRQADQLRRMSDDLLDAVRMNRGAIPLNRVRLDAVRLVSECVDAVRALADSRRQRLAFSSSEPSLWICGDASRVRQIASNLLDNAVKFTPVGGKVEVEVVTDAEWVVLHVRDSGRGIAPEHLPHIFGLFVQERSGSAGGLGIGLSVVKHLTEAHGGRFEARSAGVGFGSTFTVRLPAHIAAAHMVAV